MIIAVFCLVSPLLEEVLVILHVLHQAEKHFIASSITSHMNYCIFMQEDNVLIMYTSY